MLKTLTRNFSNIIKKARGHGRLSEENIAESLAEFRAVLLEADVALPATDIFLSAVKDRAANARIDRQINPGQAFAEIVRRELTAIMGGDSAELNLKKTPAIVLACGLQGVGKTTNMAKIAKLLKSHKKRVILGSTDVRRPAALKQLAVLADSIGVEYADGGDKTEAIPRAEEIVRLARRRLADAVLIDTAGRVVLDDEMMDEIRQLSETVKPAEKLFFVDAMQGQDAINTARQFHEQVSITGVVLTKFDGDSRGGAALSARTVTGAPIKFVGVGEKLDDIQAFHPARIAARLLGMGDMASLAEQAIATDDGKAGRALQRAIQKPHQFDLNDQLMQLRQIKKMGGLRAMADKMPAALGDKIQDSHAEKLTRMEAVICSMTPAERARPEIIKASRKKRIAAGAGVTVPLVNELLKQHEQTRKMMKRVAKNPSALARMAGGMFGS